MPAFLNSLQAPHDRTKLLSPYMKNLKIKYTDNIPPHLCSVPNNYKYKNSLLNILHYVSVNNKHFLHINYLKILLTNACLFQDF